MDSDPLLRVAEIATRLALSQSEVRKLLNAGDISCVRVGCRKGGLRAFASAVDQYLVNAQTSNPRTPRRQSPSRLLPRSAFDKRPAPERSNLEALGFFRRKAKEAK
jgi:excisionase family DNA binding protein